MYQKFSGSVIRSLVFILPIFIGTLSFSQPLLNYQSGFRYLKGKDASAISNSWNTGSFNDSSWPTGQAPFRYGDGTGGTELTDMINGYTTLYLRSVFNCTSPQSIRNLVFTADYDDGFIVWVNGVKALEVNAPASPANNSVAPANHESGTGERFTVTAAPLNLAEGPNLIAVQCFNVSLASTDFYFDVAMSGEISTPELPALTDTINIVFSAASGFSTSPFALTISTDKPGMDVVYTIDGSNPQSSVTAVRSVSPVTLSIDPSSTVGRAATPAYIVRASGAKAGFKPSNPVSRTFIFPDKIRTQQWPGGDWPASAVNGQAIDLDIDTRVVNDPAYTSLFDTSLKYIPSISIVTDIRNLFDPATGIYVNAFGHGEEWERECSAELINPNGSEGFNINAGLRIRGGYSRNKSFPKHGFRLFFREEYGASKLQFPLFGDEGVDEFDKIDLRCEQNYGWNNASPFNSFVREVFSRDTQKEMGRPYTRSRYYHLYLNGMYWGLFMSQERPEARYAESYFGDDEEDYDVIKIDVEKGYLVEATDGTMDSWQKLYNMCKDGFSTNASYYALEGKDQDGKPYPGGEIMVDIDNLIDYMTLIFYTGNFDAPTAVFMGNKKANNFYAIDNRNDRSKGFVFFAHDAEHSLFDEAHNPGVGLYENRVNIGSRTDNLKMEVNDISAFHPQWLHYKLSFNKEYVARFQSRAYSHFREGGVFTPEAGTTRLDKRVKEVDLAVIAESARWGDARRSTGSPYTRNGTWIPEINKIRNVFLRQRPDVVIGQLRSEGLWPEVNAPVIELNGSKVVVSFVPYVQPANVQISNPNNSGSVFYTTDGSDPRLPGGSVYPGAVMVSSNQKINLKGSSLLRARIYDNGKWSALTEVSFAEEQSDFSSLKITEIHYHPEDFISGSDTTGGKDLEFIEFKNIGQTAVNLRGLSIDSAVHYSFPSEYLLPPGRFFVVASKPSKFFNYYGLVASGNYNGNLSNAGEEILVADTNRNVIIRIEYSDLSPWPEGTDGDGYSLASSESNPSGDPGLFTYWVRSLSKGGNPFSDNIAGTDTLISETELDVLVYPNPSNGIITLRINSFDPVELYKISISDMTGKICGQLETGRESVIDLRRFNVVQGAYVITVRSTTQSRKLKLIVVR